jgi:hypothetical protein
MSAFYSRWHSELEMHERRSDYLRLWNIGCLQKGILEFACALLNKTDSYYFLTTQISVMSLSHFRCAVQTHCKRHLFGRMIVCLCP